MKIAFVVHDYHRAGGHSRYVAELAARFSAEHDVHVFANRIEPDEHARVHFHTVPGWRANALTTVLSFVLPATFQIGRGFDVIHCQGFCCFRGNVFTSHICNRAWHLALLTWEGGVTVREAIFNAVASTLEHALYRFANRSAVIAISQRVARDITRYYHRRGPIQIIYHGVDLQLFSPENRRRWRVDMRSKCGFSENEMVFLYVGDLRKGARRCIRALARVPEARLLFVSRTPADPYRRLADDAGVGNRVTFLAATSEVEKVYAAADAFLHPTPYDAFGMVVSEAMACGLPAVVSREAGASELIEHGVNGLLIEDLSSEAELAEHMRRLHQDRAAASQLGLAARKRMEAFSWDAIAAQTMQVYREHLEKASR